MKLVAIMSVEGYAATLRRLYADHHIPVFSETDMEGFHSHDRSGAAAGWFGHGDQPVYSKMAFAFVPADKAGALLADIDRLNQDASLERPLRAFQMNVEKWI